MMFDDQIFAADQIETEDEVEVIAEQPIQNIEISVGDAVEFTEGL